MSETDLQTDHVGTSSSLECLLCDTKFKSKRIYLKHMKDHQPDDGNIQWAFRCELCNIICDTEDHFREHILEVHDGEAAIGHICELCGTKFITKAALKIHIESQCGTNKLFRCEICNGDYTNKASLAVHELSHNGERNFCCSFCGKDFLSQGELKVHERKHTKEKPFKCDVCNKSFPYRESLVTHSSVHTGIKPYVCENCGKTFSCVGNLRKHRRVRPYTCGAANFSDKPTRIAPRAKTKKPKIQKTAKIQLLSNAQPVEAEQHPAQFEVEYLEDIDDESLSKEHIKEEYDETVAAKDEIDNDPLHLDTKREVHSPDSDKSAYMIDIEEYTFESSDENDDNSNDVNLKDNPITDLNSIINTASELHELAGNVSEAAKLIKVETLEICTIADSSTACGLCTTNFKTTNELLDHLIDVHNLTDDEIYRIFTKEEPEVQCSFCDKIYHIQVLYERHLKSHEHETAAKQPNSAIIEPNTIPIKTKDEIIASTYSTDFHCTKCDKKCLSRSALRNHVASNCGTSAPFKCNVCNKVYHSLGSLKTHQTLHTGEKPFMCSYCGKKFRTKGEHDVHARKHTGEKPFGCHVCSKSFSYRQSLVTHITTHTGEKPFVCQCGQSFSCVKNLLSHRNTFSTTCGKTPLNTKAVIPIGVIKGQLYVGETVK